jgi:hypothetical protein
VSIQFPSFAPDTPGTLLDSENAQKVKTFIEAFNRAQLVIGDKTEVLISDNNVVICLSSAELGALFRSAFDNNTAGIQDAIHDLANDIATDRANDAVAAISSVEVATCDPGGTIEVLLR